MALTAASPNAHLSLDALLAASAQSSPLVARGKSPGPIGYRHLPTPPGSDVDPDSPPVTQKLASMASITESPAGAKCVEACGAGKATLSVGFSCTFCNKQFRKRSLLAAHERIHQNLRPFKCDQCPKDFRDFGALSSHKIRLHSREFLKFNCTICTKRFRYERELEIHQRMHTGAKPYHCGFCDKRFTQLGNQRSHVRRHFVRHGFVKFPSQDNTFAAKCVLCNTTFANGVSMEAHTKVHISDEDVAALKQKTTDVLWTAGGSTKGPAKAAKAPKAPRASKASAKENQENVAVSQLHAMRGKSVSPDRRPDMQAALTLAALLGGGRPAAKEFAPAPAAAPQKGMPFADHNMGVQPTGYQMYPTMAGHNGAAGYYVYVPGPNENQ